MTKVAKRFNVSDSYLARICADLNVPKPPPGYWAKLAVGKAPPRKPLPPLRPADPEHWSRNGQSVASRRPIAPVVAAEKKRIRIARDAVHPVIRGARAHFEAGRSVEDGAYLKPYKKLLVDITTSKAGLDPALNLASMIFNAMEARGHRVIIARVGQSLRRKAPDEREAAGNHRERWQYSNLWSPGQPTVVYVGEVAIGLSIIEMSERVVMRYVSNGRYVRESDYVPPRGRSVDHGWTTERDVPSGRFRIVAYSPFGLVEGSEHWQDTKASPLRNRIRSIVEGVEAMAPVLVEKIRQADHEAELRRLRWVEEEERRRRDEDRKRVAQSIDDSRTDLQQIIDHWSRVISVEQFLQGVLERAQSLPVEDKDQVLSRLELVRKFIGTQDPLDFFRTWKTPEERYAPKYTISDEG